MILRERFCASRILFHPPSREATEGCNTKIEGMVYHNLMIVDIPCLTLLLGVTRNS